jgi:hypothetical protein
MPNNKYLSPDQESQFVSQLNAQLTPEQQQAAIQQGADMAAQDLASAGATPPAGAPVAPVDSGAAGGLSPEIMEEFGVSSIEELVAALREASGKSGEYKQMLTDLLAFSKAKNNQQQLDPSDPMHSVKAAIREEMGPVLDELGRKAKNKIVQDAWGEAAKEMPDLMDLQGDIAEYIKKYPELAVDENGLRRAYDGVRSQKYRSEDALLDDDEFVKKAAANEKVKNAVLSAHLNEIARNGEPTPPSIGEVGGTPLAGAKAAPDNMEKAKRGLLSMLGGK